MDCKNDFWALGKRLSCGNQECLYECWIIYKSVILMLNFNWERPNNLAHMHSLLKIIILWKTVMLSFQQRNRQVIPTLSWSIESNFECNIKLFILCSVVLYLRTFSFFLSFSLSLSPPLPPSLPLSLSLSLSFRAAPVAYGGSQARGWIGGAVAASLCHSHSNVGSRLRLQPTPQLMAMSDPYPTERGQGSNPHPHGC